MFKSIAIISYENILKKLYNKFKNNVTLLTKKEDYLGMYHECQFKCNICGQIFKLSVYKLLRRKKPCDCIKKIKYNELSNILNKKNISILDIKDEYNIDIKFVFECNDCKNIWCATIRNVCNGKKCCTKCTKHYCYNIDEIQNFLYKNQNNKIEIFKDTFKYITKTAKFKCKICDNTWSTSCNLVVYGKTGCPKCKLSKGERKIETILITNNIKFENQKTFENCKNIKKLLFDFYLPEYNICIEFDGKQHFQPYNFSKKQVSEKSLKKYNDIIKNDNIKNIYCLDNNIKLLRIKYTEFNNIENILKNNININEKN